MSYEGRLTRAVELVAVSLERSAIAAEEQLAVSKAMLTTQQTLAKGSQALEKELTGGTKKPVRKRL